ncbi:hypothetical protein [Halodesulfovibrio aestuarii]|uniref:hypothetical protein n=1 Tax=Halodesulfovibrio aestuarii TaxID=126333 RepID=UPI000556C306
MKSDSMKAFLRSYHELLARYHKICLESIEAGKEIPSVIPYLEEMNLWGEAFGISAPKIRLLKPLFLFLPPIVKRTDLGKVVLSMVPKTTVAYDDRNGTGPRVKFKIGQSVCYPTGYLLEYLEKKSRLLVKLSDKVEQLDNAS